MVGFTLTTPFHYIEDISCTIILLGERVIVNGVRPWVVYSAGVSLSLEPSDQTVSEGSEAVLRITAVGDSDLQYSVMFQSVDGTAEGKPYSNDLVQNSFAIYSTFYPPTNLCMVNFLIG